MLHSDMSRISVDYSLSHGAEQFRRGESLGAPLNSGTEKVCIIERWEGKNFVLLCRKLS